MRRTHGLFVFGWARRLAFAALLVGAASSLCLAEANEHVSSEAYLRHLRDAKVWTPTDIAGFDVVEGVGGPPELRSSRDEYGRLVKPVVHCTFREPEGDGLAGLSAKFRCKAHEVIGGQRGKKLSVKYDPAELLPQGDPRLPPQGYSGEVYSEVAASRLLTAIGFNTDTMFPATVVCHDCPEEPFTYLTHPELREGMARVERLVLERAAIEIKAEGEELGSPRYDEAGQEVRDGLGQTVYEHLGWGLDQIRKGPAASPSYREQVYREGLVILLGLLQHADNKPSHQRLLCTEWDRETEGCLQSYLVVQDLGSLFGHGVDVVGDLVDGAFPRVTKYSWKLWDQVDVWKRSGGDCELKVNTLPNMGGVLPVENSFRHKVVSASGRDFLVGLLGQLSDEQIADLFLVAQTRLRDEWVRPYPFGHLRPVTVEHWVHTFKAKRAELANTSACHGEESEGEAAEVGTISWRRL